MRTSESVGPGGRELSALKARVHARLRVTAAVLALPLAPAFVEKQQCLHAIGGSACDETGGGQCGGARTSEEEPSLAGYSVEATGIENQFHRGGPPMLREGFGS